MKNIYSDDVKNRKDSQEIQNSEYAISESSFPKSISSIPTSFVSFVESKEIIENLLEGILKNSEEDKERFKISLSNFWEKIPIIHATSNPHFFLYLMLASFSALDETSLNEEIKTLHVKLINRQLYCILVGDDSHAALAAIAFSYEDTEKSVIITDQASNTFNSLNIRNKYKVTLKKDNIKFSFSIEKINLEELTITVDYKKSIINDDWHTLNMEMNKNKKLDDLINQMSDSSLSSNTVKYYFERINLLYEKVENVILKEDIEKEYPFHAFQCGILLLFRARYLIDIHIEKILGKGYIDFGFIVRRNKNNEVNYDAAKPIVVEFKNSAVDLKFANKQIEERGYIKNRFPARTSHHSAILASVNPKNVEIKEEKIELPSNFFIKFLETSKILDNVNKKNFDENTKVEIRKIFSDLYLSFFNTKNVKDYYNLLIIGHLISLPN